MCSRFARSHWTSTIHCGQSIRSSIAPKKRSGHGWAKHYPRIHDTYSSADLIQLRHDIVDEHWEKNFDFRFLRKKVLEKVALGAGYDGSLVEPAFEVFDDVRNDVELYPDVIAELELLFSRFTVVAVTNGNSNLETIGIRHLFHGVVTAVSAGAAKPARQIFDVAIREAGVGPEEILHVGDHPETDIEGARQAGLRTAWINRNGERWPDDVPAPDAIVADMTELRRTAGTGGLIPCPAQPLVIYIPGLKPKPEPDLHREQLLRCLTEGVRRLDPVTAAAINEPDAFRLISWTYDFYGQHRDISIDMDDIGLLLDKRRASEKDIRVATSWRRRFRHLAVQCRGLPAFRFTEARNRRDRGTPARLPALRARRARDCRGGTRETENGTGRSIRPGASCVAAGPQHGFRHCLGLTVAADPRRQRGIGRTVADHRQPARAEADSAPPVRSR